MSKVYKCEKERLRPMSLSYDDNIFTRNIIKRILSSGFSFVQAKKV